MRVTSLAEWNCSVARTLDVVGEWWTLLILRDAFRGTRRFDDFQESLGLARSVLTARLGKLTEHGVLERRPYSDHPPRYEYHLTDKGRALFPVIAALIHWGDEWEPGPAGPPVVFVHDTCGNITTPVLTCPHCHGEVSAANTHSQPGPGASQRGLRPGTSNLIWLSGSRSPNRLVMSCRAGAHRPCRRDVARNRTTASTTSARPASSTRCEPAAAP